MPADELIAVRAGGRTLVKCMFAFQRNLPIFPKVETKDTKKLLKIAYFLNTTTLTFSSTHSFAHVLSS